MVVVDDVRLHPLAGRGDLNDHEGTFFGGGGPARLTVAGESDRSQDEGWRLAAALRWGAKRLHERTARHPHPRAALAESADRVPWALPCPVEQVSAVHVGVVGGRGDFCLGGAKHTNGNSLRVGRMPRASDSLPFGERQPQSDAIFLATGLEPEGLSSLGRGLWKRLRVAHV
jgi:hypothetical protein